jgi:hypothetical protein
LFYSNKDLALAQQVQTSLDEQKQVNLMLKEPIDLRLDMDELRATFMSTAQGRVTSWRGNPGTTRMYVVSAVDTMRPTAFLSPFTPGTTKVISIPVLHPVHRGEHQTAGRHFRPSMNWTNCVPLKHFSNSIESSNQKAGRGSRVL